MRTMLSFLLFFALFGGIALRPGIAEAALRAPDDLELTSGKYTNDSTPTFTWDAVDGATWYDYKLNDGNYKSIGNVTSYTLSSLSDGWYTFAIRAHSSSQTSSAHSYTFHIDTEGPTVPRVTPSTADVGESVTFTVEPYGEAWVMSCNLYVNGSNVGAMSADMQTFTRSYTFTSSGSYTVGARCTDGDGNTTKGTERAVTVSGTTEANPGDVIKTHCAAYATASDPCRSVYYYGEDGKRHAFPNESTYYSWYDNFRDVEEVSTAFMASLQIGSNVTFRPGSVLVEFTSDNAIYAIDDPATLRKYTSTSLLRTDYGSQWSSYVRTLPDYLFGNYDRGAVIDSSNDYDPDDAWDAVRDIDDVL